MILCVCYHKFETNLQDLKQRSPMTGWRRYLMLLLIEWPTNGRRFRFWIHMIISLLHVPPMVDLPAPLQLIIFLRISNVITFLRHNHPMRFGNVMELVSSISPIELEDSDFLLKTYFVKYPLSSLFCLYMYVVWGLGYAIFVLGFGLIFFSS